MVSRKHLLKLKHKFTNSDGFGLKESLLYAIALGEKIPLNFSGNREATQVFSGLRRYKFIRQVKAEGKGQYIITNKGEDKLRNILIDEVVIKSPKRWDGKWRLVMYDFPIRFKKARDAFRWKLKDLGFFQFQKSAWIYPYPCEGEILFVADFYGVRKHIEILEVDKVLDEKKLKSHFEL